MPGVATLLAVLLGTLLAACGDEATEIPADAVSEASGVMGGSADDALPLAPADIERLASQSNVERDVVESVGSSLVDRDVWAQSMDGVRAIYDEVPAGVESTLVDVACTAGLGTVQTDYQLHYAIFQRVNGFDTEEINGLTETTFDLFRVVYDASRSDRAEDRVAAVLTCHTLGQLLG
jgi:hypothetical protein